MSSVAVSYVGGMLRRAVRPGGRGKIAMTIFEMEGTESGLSLK